jgi:hypothetical protein
MDHKESNMITALAFGSGGSQRGPGAARPFACGMAAGEVPRRGLGRAISAAVEAALVAAALAGGTLFAGSPIVLAAADAMSAYAATPLGAHVREASATGHRRPVVEISMLRFEPAGHRVD